MTGRIVAAHSIRATDLFLDRRYRTHAQLERIVAELKDCARHWRGSRARVFLAMAAPGLPDFVCWTLKADKRGHVRLRHGWPWPNGNRLISSCSVLGVRRQRNPRKAVRP